eukprot:gene11438-15325_t
MSLNSVLCIVIASFIIRCDHQNVAAFNFNFVNKRSLTYLYQSDNVDIFSGSSATSTSNESSTMPTKLTAQAEKYKNEAEKLRKEAAQMEVLLREEARAKGLPEEMINKLVPLTSNRSPTTKTETTTTTVAVVEKPKSANSVRSKLGYLVVGDAVRMTSELDRFASKGLLKNWNSFDLAKPNYQVNDSQMKAKTNIDAVKLKLDDVGYDYKKVFFGGLVFATIFALSSSTVGGQLGFYLGYLSALLPILLVGVGSIAPALVGDIISQISYLTNEEAKKKYIVANAGKFLVGYVIGLPVANFNSGGPSNTADFFQIRPESSKSDQQVKQMFSTNKFKQNDIARSSILCLAGSVAQCIEFGESSGNNPNDVNILYELIGAIDPPLSPDNVQNHIRWSTVQAYTILKNNKEAFNRLIVAFENKQTIEECIAVIEGVPESV